MESSSTSPMACLLKIESHKSKWDKSLEKLLKPINDVSFMIDKRSKTVYISGKIDPEIILEKIKKSGKNISASIVWSNNGNYKQQEPEYTKDNKVIMEQCNAAASGGYMNAYPPPNGFHYNQGLYPPPPNYWMNQPQVLPPYGQTFAPPPPYTRQFHPQPPAPPPYEFVQKDPVAKSFPQTPVPPKNFAMGDLQLGLCNIM